MKMPGGIPFPGYFRAPEFFARYSPSAASPKDRWTLHVAAFTNGAWRINSSSFNLLNSSKVLQLFFLFTLFVVLAFLSFSVILILILTYLSSAFALFAGPQVSSLCFCQMRALPGDQ